MFWGDLGQVDVHFWRSLVQTFALSACLSVHASSHGPSSSYFEIEIRSSEGRCGEVAQNSRFLMLSQNGNNVNVTSKIFSKLTLQERGKEFY